MPGHILGSWMGFLDLNEVGFMQDNSPAYIAEVWGPFNCG